MILPSSDTIRPSKWNVARRGSATWQLLKNWLLCRLLCEDGILEIVLVMSKIL